MLPSDLDEDKDWAATNAANGGQVTLARDLANVCSSRITDVALI